MSKKNNISKRRIYSDWLKEEEKRNEERRLQKLNQKDTNRLTHSVANEISGIAIGVEKEEKMELDVKTSKKKQRKFAKKRKHN